MKHLPLVFALILLNACSNSQADKPNGEEFSAGKALAELKNKKLEEASGLAASINNPGLLWTHNDSQNGADIFLVDESLNVKLTCRLAGIENRDWEDITVGPGPEPGKNYIYVGEIGDNLAKYQYKIVYRLEEPTLKTGSETMTLTDFDTITFQLPGEKKDTEALLIHPVTKNLYVISKREQPVHVYELAYPYSTTDTLTATDLGTLPFTHIVAGDFSAKGDEILLKNYQNVYYWRIDEGVSVMDALQKRVTILPYQEEPQGESITFARDNSGYYTISEKKPGEKAYLFFYKRK